MSGGPYGPGGVLSDFEGGGGRGGSPRCIIGETPIFSLIHTTPLGIMNFMKKAMQDAETVLWLHVPLTKTIMSKI